MSHSPCCKSTAQAAGVLGVFGGLVSLQLGKMANFPLREATSSPSTLRQAGILAAKGPFPFFGTMTLLLGHSGGLDSDFRNFGCGAYY